MYEKISEKNDLFCTKEMKIKTKSKYIFHNKLRNESVKNVEYHCVVDSANVYVFKDIPHVRLNLSKTSMNKRRRQK